jgi:mRNA interferase HigB
MEIVGKKRLEKLKRKNKGNVALKMAIDDLIRDLENHTFQTQEELKNI